MRHAITPIGSGLLGPPPSTTLKNVAQRRASRGGLFQFTLKGMDELAHFPDEASRSKALDELGRDVRLRDLAVGALILAAVVLAAAAGARLLTQWLLPGVLGSAERDVALLFGVAMGFLAMRWLHRWGAARTLRRKLLRCGVPVCTPCGYLLRGLPPDAAICPECGGAVSEEARAILRQKPGGDVHVAAP